MILPFYIGWYKRDMPTWLAHSLESPQQKASGVKFGATWVVWQWKGRLYAQPLFETYVGAWIIGTDVSGVGFIIPNTPIVTFRPICPFTWRAALIAVAVVLGGLIGGSRFCAPYLERLYLTLFYWMT